MKRCLAAQLRQISLFFRVSPLWGFTDLRLEQSPCRFKELEDVVGWLDALEAEIDFELSAMMSGVGEVRP